MRKKMKYCGIVLLIFFLISSFLPVFASASNLSSDDKCNYNEAISEEEFNAAGYTERMPGLEPDLYTLVFRNVSGAFVIRSFGYPVKYYDNAGKIRDISLKLEKTDECFKAQEFPMDIRLGANLDEGYSIVNGDNYLSLLPMSVSDGVAGELSSDCKFIMYNENESLSYEYSLSYSGVKENIILNNYFGVSSFRFKLITNGYALKYEGEDILIDDTHGKTVGGFDDILIYSGDESEYTFGSISYEEVIPEQEYVINISVPVDFLTNENTAYPVIVDPSINIQYDSSADAGAIEDVTVYSDTTSSGTSGSLFVGLHESYGKSRTLMRFPRFDIMMNSLHIDSECIALAYVEIRDIACDHTPVDVFCHKYSGNSWTESGNPSWSSLGSSFVGQLLDQKTVNYGYGLQSGSGTNHRYRFNITESVRDWIKHPGQAAKGLVFKASDSFENGNTFFRKTFASYNRASYKPSLTIIYNNRYLVSTDDIGYYADEDSLQYCCNCYGYAMRLNYLDDSTYEYCNKYYPGEIWNKSEVAPPDGSLCEAYGNINNNNDLQSYYDNEIIVRTETNPNRIDQILELIELDCDTLGVGYYGAYKFTNASQISHSEDYADRRLILLVASRVDFHFYVQNEDNTWSHKPGSLGATCGCLACTPNVPLTNNTILNHINEEKYEYDFDYSFFYVGIPAAPDTFSTNSSDNTAVYGNLTSYLDCAGSNTNNSKHLDSTSFYGKIDYKGDVDYYSLNVKTKGNRIITINTLNPETNNPRSFPLVFEIRDALDIVLASCNITAGTGTITYQFEANNLYYFKIYSVNQTGLDNLRQYSIRIS